MKIPLRRMMLMILPAGALIGLSVAAAVTHLLPETFESEVIIEPISGVYSGGDFSLEGRQRVLMDTKSPAHLSTVADKLGLPGKWGVDKATAVRVLTESMDARFCRESDLISVRVRNADKEDARDIASEVVAVYGKSRADAEYAHLERCLSELKVVIVDWEGKVSANRQILEELGETTTRNITVEGTETLLHIAPSEKRSKAREDLESSEEILLMLKAKLFDQTWIKRGESGIRIHEYPKLAQSPVSPNVPLNLVLGSGAGALLAPLLARVGMGLMDRSKSRRRDDLQKRFS